MKISNAAIYFKAIAKVEVEGFFVERLINLCKINNIKIWNISYLTPGRISFNISPKELKKIRKFIRKTKCKLKIVKKQGIYFDLFRYRKRKIAFCFIIFLILCSFFVSSFVWKINIVGNEKVSKEQIYKMLEESGVKVGKNKLFISKGKSIDYIRAKNYDIAWVGIDISGTIMDVKIVEKTISQEKENKSKLGNIIANKSGIITKIIAQNGTAKLKTGSYIQKDMVAIEGVIPNNLTEPTRVHASGILKASIEYNYEKEFKYNQTIQEFTNRKKHGIGVKLNNKEIILKYLPKKYKYDINNEVKKASIFGLNISFIFNTYNEYIQKDVSYTYDQLIENAKNDVIEYEKNILKTDSVILDKITEISKQKEGIKYKVTYKVEENIGSFVETGEK